MHSSPRGELPARRFDLRRLEARAARYVNDAHAPNTRRAYQHDWQAFAAWCDGRALVALPASSDTLALYLTHLAERGLRASTIRRARIAVGLAHAHAGAPRPDRDARLRALERGIGRTHGTREEGAPPLLGAALARAVASLGDAPRDARDRALLLLGFAAALRASELAGLNIADVTFSEQGVGVAVRRSKEDQLGKGAHTLVPYGASAATCPVRALQAWLARVGRPAGPLFRVVTGATIEHQRISTRCVTRAVQRAVARAGVNGHYSSHSLRAGLATDAYAHGATPREIQLQGRWQDVRSVERYIRMECVPGRRSVVEGLL
jgi:site-specific recombinase XerD